MTIEDDRRFAALYLLSRTSRFGRDGRRCTFVDAGYNIISMPHPEALKTLDAAEQAVEEAETRSRGQAAE